MRYVRIDQNALVKVNRSKETSLEPTSPRTANCTQSTGEYVVPDISSFHTIHSPLSPRFNPYFHIPPLPTPLQQLLPYGPLRSSDPPRFDGEAMDIDPPLPNVTYSDMSESEPSCSKNAQRSPSPPNKGVIDDSANFTSDRGGNSGITALPNVTPAMASHSSGVNSTTSDDMTMFSDSIPLTTDALSPDQTIGTTARWDSPDYFFQTYVTFPFLSPFVDSAINPVEGDFTKVSGGVCDINSCDGIFLPTTVNPLDIMQCNTSPTDHDHMHIDFPAPSFGDDVQTPVDYGHDFDADGTIDDTQLPYSADTPNGTLFDTLPIY